MHQLGVFGGTNSTLVEPSAVIHRLNFCGGLVLAVSSALRITKKVEIDEFDELVIRQREAAATAASAAAAAAATSPKSPKRTLICMRPSIQQGGEEGEGLLGPGSAGGADGEVFEIPAPPWIPLLGMGG